MSARVWHDDHVRAQHLRNRRLLAVVLLFLIVLPSLVGCVRVRASITVSPDDRVSGQIVAAAAADPRRQGPAATQQPLVHNKVAVSDYSRDDYVGLPAVFSDLTFAELPQLANMNRDAAGVDISLRRAGDLVILEGRADLTSLSAPRSRRVAVGVVPRRGDVDERRSGVGRDRGGDFAAGRGEHDECQAPITDPVAGSFTGAAIWLAVGSFLVAGIIGRLAYMNRDQTPRVGERRD